MAMGQWVNKMWLVLAIAALLTGIVVTLTDGFIYGKAYTFFVLSAVCVLLWKYKKNLIG